VISWPKGSEIGIIRDDLGDGLVAARARGHTGCQQLKLTPCQARIAQQMYGETGPDGEAPLHPGTDHRRVRRQPLTIYWHLACLLSI
jgi:hypothetical protein